MRTEVKVQPTYINFGPQHPAAHGVLRLILKLSGEVVLQATPHIGLLHRGTEKLLEFKSVQQGLPYFDRLDYVSMLANEHVFSLVVEAHNKLQVALSTQYFRILLLELTRILNHLLSLTTHAMDVGALTPFLWAFEEREKLMEFYERVSGARMHANLIDVQGPAVFNLLSASLLNDINQFLTTFSSRLDEMEELLTTNRIWVERLKGVGVVSVADVLNYGFSGVLMRSTGLRWDIRKTVPYESYNLLDFASPVGVTGDCYDRYLLRVAEMRQSVSIMSQCLVVLLRSLYVGPAEPTQIKPVRLTQPDMEQLITHFKYFSQGLVLAHGATYISVEAPKGEFGSYLVTTAGGKRPYRCKIHAPGFFHLQGLNLMSRNHLIADIVTIIGTQDIVFGEVDR